MGMGHELNNYNVNVNMNAQQDQKFNGVMPNQMDNPMMMNPGMMGNMGMMGMLGPMGMGMGMPQMPADPRRFSFMGDEITFKVRSDALGES